VQTSVVKTLMELRTMFVGTVSRALDAQNAEAMLSLQLIETERPGLNFAELSKCPKCYDTENLRGVDFPRPGLQQTSIE